MILKTEPKKVEAVFTKMSRTLSFYVDDRALFGWVRENERRF